MSDPSGGVGFGPFLLDPAERLLLRDGRVVPLTPKAFDLLALLVASSGHLLSKDELIEKLWPGTFVEEANLAYNVSAIRKALGRGVRDGSLHRDGAEAWIPVRRTGVTRATGRPRTITGS